MSKFQYLCVSITLSPMSIFALSSDFKGKIDFTKELKNIGMLFLGIGSISVIRKIFLR